jgi:hypothetical protein
LECLLSLKSEFDISAILQYNSDFILMSSSCMSADIKITAVCMLIGIKHHKNILEKLPEND